MSTAFNLIGLAVIVTGAALGAAALKAKLAANTGEAAKFKQKLLLSANELEFLARLEAAMPEFRFHAQVSMGALIEPGVPRTNPKAYFRLRGMFSQKIVDFVAQSRESGSVVAVIELDDRTHDSEKDSKRDAMLASAGYRIIRWQSKTKPDIAKIRAELTKTAPKLVQA
jgi:hypothetical protein